MNSRAFDGRLTRRLDRPLIARRIETTSIPRLARLSRITQIALGVLWLIDGALQFQPYMFGKPFVTDVLLPNASGQPGIIGAPITWIANLIEPYVTPFNAFAATLQVLIGLGLLHRRTVRPALLVSFVWALGIWFTGEGLGLIFTGSANPLTGAPGAAILYVLAGLMCWPRDESALGLLGVRGAQLAWATIWLLSAALWLLPANAGAGATHDAIAAAPAGVAWLTRLLSSSASAAAGQGTVIAVVMAIVSAAIAVSALGNWRPRAFLATAIAIELVFWFLGQGLGGLFTAQATDLSTAPLMIFIAAAVWAVVPAAQTRSATATAPAVM